jgi:twin BRCT domain
MYQCIRCLIYLTESQNQWLNDCTNEGYRQEEANYTVKAFHGLCISTTQLLKNERLAIERIVVSNGGSFTSHLDSSWCTHLIAEKPEGDKYNTIKFVTSIRVMRKEWVLACADKKSKLTDRWGNILINKGV